MPTTYPLNTEKQYHASQLFATPESFHLSEPVRSINKYPNGLSVIIEDQRLLGIYHFNTSVFACSLIAPENSLPQNENSLIFHSTPLSVKAPLRAI